MTVSWLKLEQYHLGELEPAGVAEVEAALASDAELRARLDAVQGDERALPELELTLPDSGLDLEPEAEVVPLFGWRKATAVVGVLAAAALALVLVQPPAASVPDQRVAWKGGELAMSLDRLRDGQVQTDPSAYQPGDRFRVRLSCPPGRRAWAVTVFQGADRAEPLGAGDLACSNGVVLDGAFELSGEELVTVCAAVDEGVAVLRAAERPAGLEGVVCVELLGLGPD